MKKATTTATCLMTLLTLCWTSAAALKQQNTGCHYLETEYAQNNLRNVSKDLLNSRSLVQSLIYKIGNYPREPGTQTSHFARKYIKRWMTGLGWTVEEDMFQDITPKGPVYFTNVVATLHAGRPRRVVLACHYDTKDSQFGVLDGAASCALLMAMAKQLQNVFRDKTSNTSKLTLQFIFFDGEEAYGEWGPTDSLYGSRHLAQKWANTSNPAFPGKNYLETIELFIMLNMIGHSDTQFKCHFAWTSEVYDKLLNIEKCLEGKRFLANQQRPGERKPLFTSQYVGYQIPDDQIPFWERDVRVVHLITQQFPEVWHTAEDNGHNLYYPRISELAAILRTFLADLTL